MFSRTILKNFRDVEVVLAELVVGRGNMLSAKFDTCKCIQAIEKQPSLGSARSISIYWLGSSFTCRKKSVCTHNPDIGADT